MDVVGGKAVSLMDANVSMTEFLDSLKDGKPSLEVEERRRKMLESWNSAEGNMAEDKESDDMDIENEDEEVRKIVSGG